MFITRLTLIFLFLCGSLSLSAQRYSKVSIRNARQPRELERYHQLHIGIGVPNSVAARNDLWYSKPLPLNAGNPVLPPMQIGYTYGASKRLQFLFHGSFEQMAYEQGNGEIDHHRSFASLALGANYRWFLRNSIALYSGFLVGGGGSFYQASGPVSGQEYVRSNYFYPVAQLTVFGASWGKRFGGYTEVALGTRGIIFGGIYYRIFE
jgi:hypothetical protein